MSALTALRSWAQPIGMAKRLYHMPSLSALAQLPRVTTTNIADVPGARRTGTRD